ncbi:MAG: hypothetical protein H2057_07950 [Alphaproteobacteria bacterium]|nr:hypothetical protein [Alphaproteobacteria bacterium]
MAVDTSSVTLQQRHGVFQSDPSGKRQPPPSVALSASRGQVPSTKKLP